MESLKWLYAVDPIWFRILALILLIFIGILAAFLYRLLRSASKEGRAIKVWGVEIGEQKASNPNTSADDNPDSPQTKTLQLHKFVYVKLISLREKGIDKPVYQRRLPDGIIIDVYDEALFFVFHLYSDIQPFGKWNVRSSGVAVPQVLYPWMNQPLPGDPQEPVYGPVVPVSCNIESSVYVPVTHMFNGQQPGERGVILRTESYIQSARLILDYSSVAECDITQLKAFRGEEPIAGYEPRHGIYTCDAKSLKMGDHLKINFEANRKESSKATQRI
jgi:hypothetical protein